ncbi:MAG: GIY-YIG nuclease family protein [Ignavibacterium sp.]|nr:MAG: GIY-YIG nuclease family protein [Ignavibacterium sp.]
MESFTGRTIQIYLPDGNPQSMKIAEITSRTVQAILIPRSKLEIAFKREELKNVGVYFLIGNPEDESKDILYVGEAEECLSRLKQQNKSKDFWNVAIVIISKTQYFTKTHIKYLEWLCYDSAKGAARYNIENTNIPNKPYTSESMEADLLDNFDTIKILTSTLGFPLFEKINKPIVKKILICKGKDAVGQGEYTSDGMIVFAGSKCNLTESKGAPEWILNLRKRLLKEWVLEVEDKVIVFKSDYIFHSPSAAAVTLLGRAANGWTSWKYKDGKTLDEVIRQK